jgi:hypothetical protein
MHMVGRWPVGTSMRRVPVGRSLGLSQLGLGYGADRGIGARRPRGCRVPGSDVGVHEPVDKGCQSEFAEDLAFLGRRHEKGQAVSVGEEVANRAVGEYHFLLLFWVIPRPNDRHPSRETTVGRSESANQAGVGVLRRMAPFAGVAAW